MYDPTHYWNRRTMPNSVRGLQQDVIKLNADYIYNCIGADKTVLDLGPGIGRLLDGFRDVKQLYAADISSMYRGRFLQKCYDMNIPVDFSLVDINESLPYSTGFFDWSVAVEVLLHQPPQHIYHVVSELSRVAKKTLVITTVSDKPSGAAHCFNHNYVKIYKGVGLKISSFEKMGRQEYTVLE